MSEESDQNSPRKRRLPRRRYKVKSRVEAGVEIAMVQATMALRWWKRPFAFLFEKLGRVVSLRWIVRATAVAVVVAVALFLLVLGGLQLWLDDQRLMKVLKDSVAEQTGGRLEIRSAEVSVLSGLQLSGVEFHPPGSGDASSATNAGATSAEPLLSISEVKFRYSLLRVFLGQIDLSAAQIVDPKIALREVDGVWNFAGILEWRAKKFPPSAPVEEPAKEKEAGPRKPLRDLLPISPALLYMPLRLSIRNVGLSNVEVSVRKIQAEQSIFEAELTGITADLGLTWRGTRSNAWFTLRSADGTKLRARLASQSKGSNAGLKTVLDTTMTSSLAVQFDDLRKLSIDGGMNIDAVESNGRSLNDIDAVLRMRASRNDGLDGIVVDEIHANLAEAIVFDTKGSIDLPRGDLSLFRVAIDHRLSTRLTRIGEIAGVFLSGIQANGEINVERLRISGDIDPEALKTGKTNTLPNVTGLVSVEGIELSSDLEAFALRLEPMTGTIGLQAGPSIGGDGSQFETTVDLDISGLELRQKSRKGDVVVAVGGTATAMTVRALYPQMIVPIFKLNVESRQVTANGPGVPTVNVPLLIEVDGDVRKDLENASLSARMLMQDLLDVDFDADCQSGCTRVRADGKARIESIASVFAIATPVLNRTAIAPKLPTKLSGAVDADFTLRGKIPPPKGIEPAALLGQSDIKFSVGGGVSGLDTDLPQPSVELRNLDARLVVSGDLKKQKIVIDQGFDRLKLLIKGESAAKDRRLDVQRFSFDTEVENSFVGAIDLKRPWLGSRTRLSLKTFVGSTLPEGVLPKALSNLNLDVVVSQSDGSVIEVEQIRAAVPDAGAVVAVSGNAALSREFVPERFRVQTKLDVNQSGSEGLVSAFRSAGRVAVDAALASDDMKTVLLEGKAKFDGFSITVPSADIKAPPLLVVEGMNGEVPFRQSVPIPKPKDTSSGETPPGEKDETKPVEQPSIAQSPVGQSPIDEKEKFSNEVDAWFERNEDKILENTNMMALVDYGSVRPFYPGRTPISIERVEAANLELTKMEFDVELRQNWFSLNQFVMSFLSGKIQGGVQVAFDPGPRRIRVSTHLTRLDTHKLLAKFPNLKGKKSTWSLTSNPYLDATLHLNYDFRSSDMSGGLEITSIGKEQLRMILYYVDPNERDPVIRDIRRALTVGDVRLVKVPIRNGEIGLDVDVRLLAAPIPVPKLTRFPISQIVANFKAQAASQAAPTVQDEKSEPLQSLPANSRDLNPVPASKTTESTQDEQREQASL